jgi:septum site-determining protein MinD
MILAVVGGKGGVGTTTVAYNLAAALDAVLVDADLGMADLPAPRGPDLHDVLAGRASALEAIDEGTPVPLLPCGRTLAGFRAAEPTALVEALDTVAAGYERVVVDCPAGMGSDVGLSLFAADACVVVTNPEATALSNALRIRALARELDVALSQVVVNEADEKSMPRDRIRTAVGAPVTEIPHSEAVATAQAHGQPVAAFDPECAASEQFRALAAAIRGQARHSSVRS